MVQEVPDATDGRSRGLLKQYGDDLLDRLDELRLTQATSRLLKNARSGAITLRDGPPVLLRVRHKVL
ncbi:MAG: hypothetical protein CMM60_07000 [Rhodospirillaceae bacterium]|nr:hypothetical protein [Rhodospirillaceae bacterium]